MGESILPATVASLDLTHVIYDPSSYLSQLLALMTLSPILLMASYAALAVQTRELTIILMWAGQLACEAFNYVIKHHVKQERPYATLGDGYGFPSSHSQWMGYFVSFLCCHLWFRHRFVSFGHRILDVVFRFMVYLGLVAWGSAVVYSRYYLRYHSSTQVLAGAGIGVLFGFAYFGVTEFLPTRYAASPFGLVRVWLVGNPLSTWIRIRDGWAVWSDGGNEIEWKEWRKEWEHQRFAQTKVRKE